VVLNVIHHIAMITHHIIGFNRLAPKYASSVFRTGGMTEFHFEGRK